MNYIVEKSLVLYWHNKSFDSYTFLNSKVTQVYTKTMQSTSDKIKSYKRSISVYH